MKNKYLIGINQENEFIYIGDFSWDCDWYWGGGYVQKGTIRTYDEAKQQAENDDEVEYFWKESESRERLEDFKQAYVDSFEERLDILEEVDNDSFISWESHTHFDGDYLKESSDVNELFKTTSFTQKEWWRLRDLFVQFYKLRECAEVFKHGGHQTSEGRTKEEIKPEWNKRLNKHIETVIIPEIRRLLEKNQLDVSEVVKTLEVE